MFSIIRYDFLMFVNSSGNLHDTLAISVPKIILSLLLPPAILLLEFKSKAEMCHVPQTHEAMLFGLDSAKSPPTTEGSDHMVKCQWCAYPALFSKLNKTLYNVNITHFMPRLTFSFLVL